MALEDFLLDTYPEIFHAWQVEAGLVKLVPGEKCIYTLSGMSTTNPRICVFIGIGSNGKQYDFSNSIDEPVRWCVSDRELKNILPLSSEAGQSFLKLHSKSIKDQTN